MTECRIGPELKQRQDIVFLNVANIHVGVSTEGIGLGNTELALRSDDSRRYSYITMKVIAVRKSVLTTDFERELTNDIFLNS